MARGRQPRSLFLGAVVVACGCHLDSAGGNHAATIGVTASSTGSDAGSQSTAEPETTAGPGTSDGGSDSTSGPSETSAATDSGETSGSSGETGTPADAFSVRLGAIVPPGAPGAQEVDVGFEPDVVLLFGSLPHDAGVESTVSLGRGWGIDGRQAAASTGWNIDSNNVADRLVEHAALTMVSGGDVVLAEASLQSLDPAGFTLQWTEVTAGLEVSYVALAAPRLQVSIGSALLAHDEALSVDAGFEPDVLMTLATRDVTSFGTGDEGGHGFAVAVRGEKSHGSAHRERNNGNGVSGLLNNVALITADDAGIDSHWVATFGASGFELSPTGSADNPIAMTYLVLGGVSAASGVAIQPGNAGVLPYETSFPTKLVLFDGGDKQGVQPEPEAIVGVATEAVQVSDWMGRVEQLTEAVRTNGRVIVSREAGVGGVQAAAAALLSVNGFSLNWGRSDGQPREVGWLAIGP